MKKILLFVLSIMCIFSFTMASACQKEQEPAKTNANAIKAIKKHQITLLLINLEKR